MQRSEHIPVLLHECIQSLNPQSGQRFIDATIGGGGHSEAILLASSPEGQLLGLDTDPRAIERCARRLSPFHDRIVLASENFRYLEVIARQHEFISVAGILIDLGVSSFQLDDPEQGFSFREDGPLDMRMDPAAELSAADIVNEYPQDRIADILWQYGEERRSRRIARAIIRQRPHHSTVELAEVISQAVGGRRGARIHPATRSFQALRIFVNAELDALQEVLPQAISLLAPSGVLAVISFHSLEDRIVKQFLRRESRDCICPPRIPICQCQHKAVLVELHRKGISPTPEEVQRNPRSRSARLRAARKLQTGEEP